MQAFDSNDKIGVYYFRPSGVPTGTDALHAGVFYSTVEAGNRVTRTFDAGPANTNVSGVDGALEVAKELIGIRDPATPYGKMTMTSNKIDGMEWQSGEIPLPDGIVGGAILASGSDLSQNWGQIRTTFEQAASGLYYYFPWLQNSNTVAITALSNGGITWAPVYPDSAIYSVPTGIGQSSGGRPTIMQPFSPETGPDGVELFFPGANQRLSTSLTPSDFANGVPFERDGYIYTYTNFLGHLTIKAEPTEATIALRGELAAYNASVDEINKLVEETWVKPNGETVDRKFQYSGDDPSPSDVTKTFSRNDSPTAQEQDFPAGRLLKYYDTQNYHPYSKLEVSEGADGKPTNVQFNLDNDTATRSTNGSLVDLSVIGQVFGSAIGRILAPNNQFGHLLGGTVGGLIGQKLVQNFAASLTFDASKGTNADFATFSGLDVASAAAGSVASFLIAEIGTALHLDGYAGQLFNNGGSAFTGSILNTVIHEGGLQVLAQEATWATAFATAEGAVGGTVGGILAQNLVHAESKQGAVGGQLLGAVGSALGVSFVALQALTGLLNFVIPGVGSFFGTILGTMLGDAIAGDPGAPKAFHDVQILGSDTHFTNRLVGTDDHGNAAVSQKMSGEVVTIANNFLDSIHGAGIFYPGKVMIGYNDGNGPYDYVTGWFPNGTEAAPRFTDPNDAIQEGVRELLMQTEVIGGDLLLKRAQQAFISGSHPDPYSDPTNFKDLIGLSGDLRTAQDYEIYLNNREAINALMAANPDTAFTAGWIATFARVNDLGLNHVNASDFLGGLVMGYFDSVKKAGLNFDAANASVKHGSGSSIVIEIRVANSVDVPGSLSVFADQTNEISDAAGKTVQFVFNNGLAPVGFHGPASATLVSGIWQVTGGAGNNLWFGRDDVPNEYHDDQSNSNDILVGGALNDVIHAGNGSDFVDGGAGDDRIFGGSGNNVLRGGDGADTLFGGAGDDQLTGGRGSDVLQGSGGNDSYIFGRGDGADTVYDDYGYNLFGGLDVNDPELPFPVLKGTRLDGGSDSLVFGPGISVSDVWIRLLGSGDLIVGIRDPANPNVAFDSLTDKVTLQSWSDPVHRIENFRFADGTTLDLSAGQSALTPFEIPFGETFSGHSVAADAVTGTAVGTVTGLDLLADASLSYSLTATGTADGRFAIDASTGVVSVANAARLADAAATSQTITVQISDQAGHVFSKDFAIAVTSGVHVVAGTPGNDNLAGSAANETFIGGANTITPVLGDLPAQTGSMGIEWLVISTQDFTGDGKGDIMWVHDGAGVAALWTMNNGTLSSFSPTQGQMGAEWKAIGSGDFNHDGKADMVWTSGGDIALWQMDGANLTAFATPSGHMGPEWHVQVIGDFNGDGYSDILWHSDGGAVADWSMSGNALGGFGISNGALGAEWTARAAGDFNGDGRDDILWVSATGDVQTWTMNGSNYTQLTNTGHMGTEWHVAGSGDFNMDGKSDVVWVSDSNDVQIWEMNGGSIAQIVVPAGHMGTEWHHEGVSDFTGDGRPDLLWVNGSGQTSVWNMVGNGDVMTGGGGADTFRFNALNETGKVITDFQAGSGAGADVLDLHNLELAAGYTGNDGLRDGAVRLIQNGANTEVQVDAHFGEHHWLDAVTLQNVNAAALVHANFLV
jgi:hypothetical protein